MPKRHDEPEEWAIGYLTGLVNVEKMNALPGRAGSRV